MCELMFYCKSNKGCKLWEELSRITAAIDSGSEVVPKLSESVPRIPNACALRMHGEQ